MWQPVLWSCFHSNGIQLGPETLKSFWSIKQNAFPFLLFLLWLIESLFFYSVCPIIMCLGDSFLIITFNSLWLYLIGLKWFTYFRSEKASLWTLVLSNRLPAPSISLGCGFKLQMGTGERCFVLCQSHSACFHFRMFRGNSPEKRKERKLLPGFHRVQRYFPDGDVFSFLNPVGREATFYDE